MSLLDETCARIAIPDPGMAERTQLLLDAKTKPRRSLGRLEDLACRFAAIRGEERPPLPVKAIVVMAADHGVAAAGVSAYPQEVTAQMVLNFVRGGAAINVLARQAGARVVVADLGVATPPPADAGVRALRIRGGTDDFTRGPAMTRDEAVRALEAGIGLAVELASEGVTLLGVGEMGIGNTTAASALTACLTDASPHDVVGPGTGVDAAGLARKREAVQRALEVNRPDASDPLGVLACLGGFEIAGLAGAILGAASRRVAVLVDGFISGAAALVACRLEPRVAGYLIAAHRSSEPGHERVLAAMDMRPLLGLELRLGEGTGAALAMSVVDAGVRILHEMATFADAGVADSGR
jgi:nicotinate-nucleotide--dimethylbenzimidazole phosphoribosyltransferase